MVNSKKRKENASPSKNENRIQAVSFGRNYFYQRGSGLADNENDETPPWNDALPLSAVCTAQSTVILTEKGTVFQTGTLHGRVYPNWSPVHFSLPLKCAQVSAGRHFVVARMEGGQAVLTWGAGHFGQLGVTERGREDDQSSNTATAMMHAPEPVLVQRLLPVVTGSPIAQVAAGDWHCLALTESGVVWCWGSNRSLQCGLKQQPSGAPGTLALPRPISTLPELKQIAAGRSHSVALSCEGQIYSWGASQHGQCGTGISTRRGMAGLLPAAVEGLPASLEMVQIAAAGHHTLALSKAGRVFSWGDGREGQLGLSLASNSVHNIQQLQTSKPRLVADLDFVAVAAGQEWRQQQATGGTAAGAAGALANVPKIVSLEAGASYSAAISSSGHLYCWGSNDVGQLGLPTGSNLPFCDGSSDDMAMDVAQEQQQQPDNGARQMHARNFDSNHNVLLPVRVDIIKHMRVSIVALGPNHMWCFGEKRDPDDNAVVGRTLFEVQEEQRQKRFAAIQAKLQQKQDTTESSGDMSSLTDSPNAEPPETLDTPATVINSGAVGEIETATPTVEALASASVLPKETGAVAPDIVDVATTSTAPSSTAAAVNPTNTSESSGSTSSDSQAIDQSDSLNSVHETIDETQEHPAIPDAASPNSDTAPRQKRPNLIRRLTHKLRRRRSSRSAGSTSGASVMGSSTNLSEEEGSERRRGLRGIQEVLANSKRS